MKKQWLFALIAFGIIALLGIIFPISFNTGDTSGIDTGRYGLDACFHCPGIS